MTSETQYDPFAADYHWLYSDAVLTGEPFLQKHETLLNSLAPGASILDCSCGIGVHAIALARRGYDVYATDASPGMIAEARKRAQDAGVAVTFDARAWRDLPAHFNGRFEVVFCGGNSIGHCKDDSGRADALQPRFGS